MPPLSASVRKRAHSAAVSGCRPIASVGEGRNLVGLEPRAHFGGRDEDGLVALNGRHCRPPRREAARINIDIMNRARRSPERRRPRLRRSPATSPKVIDGSDRFQRPDQTIGERLFYDPHVVRADLSDIRAGDPLLRMAFQFAGRAFALSGMKGRITSRRSPRPPRIREFVDISSSAAASARSISLSSSSAMASMVRPLQARRPWRNGLCAPAASWSSR